MDERIYYVIPARAGSKGLPGKNRKLMKHTFKRIPYQGSNVVVTSDDEEILKEAKQRGYQYIKRNPELCSDTASMKDVLLDTVKRIEMNDDDIIVMLYLTYPNRTWGDVIDALEFFLKENADSLLCKADARTHPYLCMFPVNEHNGIQIIGHGLYRRQDYPEVFRISHYIFIGRVKEIQNLNQNLYNEGTVFFPVEDGVDIDTEEDFIKFQKGA